MSVGGLALIVVTFLMPDTATRSPLPDHAAGGSGRILEMRVYTLKSGTRDRFHELFVGQALPLLQRWLVEVVAYGPSLHDADSYFLVRAFDSLEDRMRREDAFYGSADWREGPREAILALIETYSTAVVRLDTAAALARGTTDGGPGSPDSGLMRESVGFSAAGTASDLATLLALNEDYIRAVEASDVDRFRDILSDDFVCSMSDGTAVNRTRFLQHVAKPAGISDLQAHDVNVRLMGDFAIVHARTTFRTSDGRDGASRYTDIWARREGRWVAVAAHVTRY